ncbi:14525_t:CDS:2 [Gigaspora rosea]|nr:14525_t:CDS:2 [Gigaspora rosea]
MLNLKEFIASNLDNESKKLLDELKQTVNTLNNPRTPSIYDDLQYVLIQVNNLRKGNEKYQDICIWWTSLMEVRPETILNANVRG